MRILVRREKIEDGTQLSLFEQTGGYRYQVIATNTRGGQIQRLDNTRLDHRRRPRPALLDAAATAGY